MPTCLSIREMASETGILQPEDGCTTKIQHRLLTMQFYNWGRYYDIIKVIKAGE